jgi:hypothetical protein
MAEDITPEASVRALEPETPIIEEENNMTMITLIIDSLSHNCDNRLGAMNFELLEHQNLTPDTVIL